MRAGALDTVIRPIIMKKNRPGWQLEILVRPGHEDRLAALVIRQTGVLGIRRHEEERYCVPREIIEVTWSGLLFRVKVGWFENTLVHCVPEYEDIRRAAQVLEQRPLDIQAAVIHVAREHAKKKPLTCVPGSPTIKQAPECVGAVVRGEPCSD